MGGHKIIVRYRNLILSRMKIMKSNLKSKLRVFETEVGPTWGKEQIEAHVEVEYVVRKIISPSHT